MTNTKYGQFWVSDHDPRAFYTDDEGKDWDILNVVEVAKAAIIWRDANEYAMYYDHPLMDAIDKLDKEK